LSSCWKNHPMAAPLAISAVRTGQLFGLTLPAKPALAPLMTISSGIAAIELPIVQETAEPVAIALSIPYPTGTISTTAADTHVVTSITPVDFSCDTPSEPVGCKQHAYTKTYPTMTQATNGIWTLAIVDDVSQQTVCTGSLTLDLACTIPARQANEAPHPYRAVLSFSAQKLVEFRPDDYNSSGDYSVGDGTTAAVTKYSGLAPQTDNLTFCSSHRIRQIHGIDYTFCIEHTSYARIVAVDKLTLALDAVPFTLATGESAIAAQPAYVTAAMLALPASTWNAGDAGF